MRFLYILSILAFVVIGAGLIAINGSVVILGAPIFLYCALAIMTTPNADRVSAAREIDRPYPTDGQRVRVRVRISVGKPTFLRIEDPLPVGIDPETLEGENSFIGKVSGSVAIEYSFLAARGPLRFEDFRCTLYGAVYAASRKLSVEARQELFCAPELLSGVDLAVATRKTLVFAGDIGSRAAGPGEEFFLVREYRPGDKIRRINYKASSDESEIFVNEFEQRRNADIGFILDTRRVNTLLPGRDGDLDALAALEFSMAQAFAKRGNRLSHMTYGQPLHWVPAGYGKMQVHKIRHALAIAESSDPVSFDPICHVPDSVFPHQSVIFLFMKILGGEDAVVRALLAKRYRLIVVTRDGESERIHRDDERRMNETARMLTAFEREQTLYELGKTSAIVYEWPTEVSAAQAAFELSRMIAGAARFARVAGGS